MRLQRRAATPRWIKATSCAAAAALGLLTLTGMADPRAHSVTAGPAQLRDLPARTPVPVHQVGLRRVRRPAMPAWHRPPVTWPAAGTGVASTRPASTRPASTSPARGSLGTAPLRSAGGPDARNALLAGVTPGSRRAGSLPVWVGPDAAVSRAAARAARQAPGPVSVTLASHRAATAAGVSGVLFSVRPGTAAAIASHVHLSLDYAAWAYADGGDFAARLHLVELPACALTTPQLAACRRQVPLATGDNTRTDRLGANVTLPASSLADRAATRGVQPAIMVAATAAPSGSAGSYAATPLSDAGTWTAGGSSGAFTYSYPIGLPPVPGGLAPQVSLDYNSQAVDGLTSTTNNQASWIGDGWDYQPGFIERDYAPCSQTSAKTGDLCWSSSDVTTLSLNGQNTELVDDPASGWHAEADNGDKITYLSGPGSNGTHDDDYWVVTDPDGTSYYFGLNELPGYASGDTQTDSAWTVPVYATASGQPCYNATFSAAKCAQAWRWNLDYVTDTHGDAIAYFYNSETNYYAADNGTKATAAYTQAGVVSRIEYGLRAGSVYGATPAGEVSFTSATDRTDVPTSGTGDLACASGATCDVISPTFWGKYRLTTIATDGVAGGSLQPADSWTLAQDYPATGDASTAPALWLESITRTGEDGGSAGLPPVSFAGTPLAGRVETAQDSNDGYSILTRERMSTVTSETGGTIKVTYDNAPASCTSGSFPAAAANSTICYPDYWTPPNTTSPVQDWFNKYVVTAVTQTSNAVNEPPVSTSYCYGTAPDCLNGGGWHYNDDPLLKSSQRTWDQWRGFGTVTTETGTAPDPVTKSVDTYFQGLDGDYQSGGGTASVSLHSTVGGVTVPDDNQWAGTQFEHTVYNGASGSIVSDTVTTPYTSAATATQTGLPAPLPSLQAFMTDTAKTQEFTALASGGYRESDVSYTHDPTYGQVTAESDVPDAADNGSPGDPSEDTCTQTTYDTATATPAWVLDLPAEVITTAEPPADCPVSGTPPKSALITDIRYYYDGATSLTTPPTKGNVSQETEATSYSGSSEAFTTQDADTFDEYGRVLTATDADGHVTSTAYTPATGAEPASVKVTDPMGLATTTTYDPVRDLQLSVTNPAGWVVTETYDALGRLTKVWTPGHPAASAPPDDTFSYNVSGSVPSVITTNTITSAGSYNPSQTLYDSLGRVVETQTQMPDGGRDVTDTTYNSDGWQQMVTSPYWTSGAPSGTLVGSPPGQVPSQTGYFYDGTGRVTRQVSSTFGTGTWETDTSYGGNYTTVTPPAGGTVETTYTNGNGQDSYLYQYHGSAAPATPPAPGAGSVSGAGGWDQTAYTYTAGQQLASVTDAAGNTWSYSYDLNGDQVSAADPDSGTTTSTFDGDGNPLTVTDARGKTTAYTYDLDGRKTGEYDTTGGAGESSADELASWTYDTLAAGELTSSTAYTGGTSGTSYTQAITGYNSYGLPSGTETVISAGPLAGTYQQGDTYGAYGDLPKSYFDPAAGGLPAETVNLGYNTSNQPISVGSSLWSYVAALAYSDIGQPQQYALGTTTEPVYLNDTYNAETGQLATSQVQTGTGQLVVDNTTYSYNHAGNVTGESDTPASGPSQVQCFSYDYLGRLTQAWAQGSAGCAATMTQPAESGAAAPYWNQYGYNSSNDLTSVTSTPPSGAATTYTNSFPAGGSTQPHAISAQQASGPGGASTTSYGYNASGDTTSITSPASSQSLSWNDDGQLSSVTTTGANAGTTSYVYDADGNLLLQTDPATVTLYLSDEQIVLNRATGATTGTRYYSIGGVTVAARTSDGSVTYLAGDQQGTASLAIDSGTLAVTRRYYDPYGNQVGAPPASWPGTRGFVGGTTDQATGLVNLGAREYNPATGSFISPDSVLNADDPQDLNAYAYAADDPATLSDPSGQTPTMPCAGDICGSFTYLKHHVGHKSPPPPPVCTPQVCGHLTPTNDPQDDYAPVQRRTHVVHQVSTGSYNAYTCSRFGRGCAGGTQAAARIRDSKQNMHWLTTVAHGLGDAGDWVLEHRIAIANLMAVGICLVPAVDIVGCAIAQGVAYGIRAQARIQHYGFRASLGANVADGLITGLALTASGTWEEQGETGFGQAAPGLWRVAGEAGPDGQKIAEEIKGWADDFPIGKYGYKLFGALPDLVLTAGEHIPSHYEIFFNDEP